ncbi:MAG: LicD family protein [Kiritimatiellae bacterium]|nr:LicD family protein [Kiritimatiellia bacterium]
MSIPNNQCRITKEDFFKEEVLCGYKVTTEMKKVFVKMIDILEEVKRICTKYNISYVVSGGSLLGAVRHQGFIPWDDDIDIAMFRKDYDRFIEVAQKELPPHLFLQTSLTDCRNIRYARIIDETTSALLPYLTDYESLCAQGVLIDIFPMDGVIPNVIKARFQNWLANLCGSIYAYAHFLNPPQGILRKIKGWIYKRIYFIFGHKRFYAFRENIFRRYSPERCGKCGLISFFGNSPCTNVATAYFEDTIEVPFEYTTVRIPRDYDPVLRQQYGDWNVLRPGTQNRPPCEMVFDLNESYKDKILRQYGKKPVSLVR